MGGKKNLKQNKKAKELMRKMESEGKRVKRAEDNKKLVFSELKKILEAKSDDENLMPPTFNCTVAQAKQAVKDRRIFRSLYS